VDEAVAEADAERYQADMDALDALWNSPEVQRTMANLARPGSPSATGEGEPDEGGDDADQVDGMRRDALDGAG
jgi:hypothetical protein